MIKGQTKIELVDINTNEKKTYLDNNMVTNAIPNLFKSQSVISNLTDISRESMLPLNSKGMGGIALFNTTLNEDVNNIALPLEDKVVGIASSNVYDGDSPRHGSRNMIESGEIENGYKYVWDFETSQGNGEIKSLGLIHAKAGMYYKGLDNNIEGSIVSSSLAQIRTQVPTVENWNTEYPYIAHFDAKTGLIYCIHTTSTNKVTITTYKIFTGFNNLGINDSIGTIKFLNKVELETSLTMQANTMWTYSEDDGYFYGFGCLKGTPINCTIVRIKADDLTFDETYIKEYIISSTKEFTWALGNTSLCVANNRLYAYSRNTAIMYLDLTDTSKTAYLPTQDIFSVKTLKVFNSMVHCGWYYFDLDLTYAKMRYKKPSGNIPGFLNNSSVENAAYISPEGACVEFSYNSSNSTIYVYYGMVYDYLATINNLSTPIIKTSAQTMKITYTITEVN